MIDGGGIAEALARGAAWVAMGASESGGATAVIPVFGLAGVEGESAGSSSRGQNSAAAAATAKSASTSRTEPDELFWVTG